MLIQGRRSAPISATMAKVASGLVADRRSSSMKSNSQISPVRAASMPVTDAMNTRAT